MMDDANSYDERIERIRDLPVYRKTPNSLGWVSAEAIAEILSLDTIVREEAVKVRYSNAAHRRHMRGED